MDTFATMCVTFLFLSVCLSVFLLLLENDGSDIRVREGERGVCHGTEIENLNFSVCEFKM